LGGRPVDYTNTAFLAHLIIKHTFFVTIIFISRVHFSNYFKTFYGFCGMENTIEYCLLIVYSCFVSWWQRSYVRKVKFYLLCVILKYLNFLIFNAFSLSFGTNFNNMHQFSLQVIQLLNPKQNLVVKQIQKTEMYFFKETFDLKAILIDVSF
jgi:hypothetical protein